MKDYILGALMQQHIHPSMSPASAVFVGRNMVAYDLVLSEGSDLL